MAAVPSAALTAAGARAGERLAVGAAPAAAGGARGHVSALRGAHAPQRPAGRGRPAPRAAGRQPAAARRGGRRPDPRRQAGPRPPVASLLDQGTTTRSAEDINDAIDFIGGSSGAGAGADLTYINVVVMKDSFGRACGSGVRHGRASGVRARGDRAPAASRRCRACRSAATTRATSPTRCSTGWSTGPIPTAGPTAGTPETVAAITRDDLVAFHDRCFAPNNAILAIVGDVTAERGVRRGRARVRRLAEARSGRRPTSSIRPPADAARRRDRQAGRGADRDPRRATSASRARAPTTCRSTSPSGSSAARAPTACTACCAPSAA